jgi:hypothetical protein
MGQCQRCAHRVADALYHARRVVHAAHITAEPFELVAGGIAACGRALTTAATAPEFERLPVAGPTLIAAQKSQGQTQGELIKSVTLALAGFDISSQPRRWVPYASMLPEVLKASRRIAQLIGAYPALQSKLKALAEAEKFPFDQWRFLPMVIHKAQWTAVLSPDASRIVGYFHVDGFVDEKQAAPAAGKTPVPATKAEKAPARPQ